MAEYRIECDFRALVTVFERAPARLEELVRTQLKMAVRDIKEYAAGHHRYTTRSGALENRGIVTRVEGNAGYISLSDRVPYAVYVHEGTRAHTITPRNKQVLRFVSRGEFVFAKRVRHPGTRRDPFLYDAADHEMPQITSRFSAALSRLMEDL